MQRKEEVLWKKLKIEVTANSKNDKIGKIVPNDTQEYQKYIQSGKKIQEEEINSPTFRKNISTKSEQKELVNSSFSFGEQMLHQLQFMLNDGNEDQKNLKFPCCIRCNSICIEPSDQGPKKENLIKIINKIKKFAYEVKYIIQGIKLGLKNYQDGLESQKNYFLSYMNLILSNILLKTTSEKQELLLKISKQQQQINFLKQKSNILQATQKSLEYQINEFSNNLNSQRSSKEYLNKKIHQLNDLLYAKTTQNSNLIGQNMTLKLNLKNQQSIPNQLIVNYQQKVSENCSNPSSKTFIESDEADIFSGKIKTNTTRSRKSSICSGVCVTPTTPKDQLLDFTESVTFSNTGYEDFLGPPVCRRSTLKNYTVLQQKEKNGSKIEKKIRFQEKSQKHSVNPSQQKSVKLERKNQGNSVKPARKYSLKTQASQFNFLNFNKGEKQQERFTQNTKSSHNIFERIKKLKQHISFQIQDLRKENL